ncbi:HAD family hydrolase [Novosphingobium sp. 9]|uniref:HAD family hydrolase n=1 Tax=Novosphingobium sp. 9 TaxID=2025349 RepID=UPI0021B55699|nr:HAD family phosphatase [Novosphingobium sp. 9]
MDGTLLDTEAMFHTALGQAAKAVGQVLTQDHIHQMVGIHREENEKLLRRLWGEDFQLETFYRQVDVLFEAAWREGVPLRPGAVELLDSLRAAGLPLGLCTSSTSPDAEERLKIAGLFDYFQHIVTISHVTHPKPHPDPYLLTAKKLGIDPADCVTVEDSPNGLRAAAGAGTMALLVPDMVPANDETRALACAVLPDLHAVSDWIAQALTLEETPAE